MRDLGLGLVVGLLVGAFAWRALERSGASPPVSLTSTARAASVGQVGGACPPFPALVPPGTPVDAAAVIEAQDRQIRELSVLAFGQPLVWPDPEMPSEIEESLQEALASCAPGVRLIESDCSEPPCLAAFEVETGDTVSDLCPDLRRTGYTSANVPCPDGSWHSVHVVKVGTEMDYRTGNEVEGLDFGKNAFNRFQVRAEDLMGAFACP